jgi:acyl-CoA dehydrogenase
VLDADTSEIAIAPTGAAELVGLRAALYRALLLAGAAGAALTQAVHYAPQRVQFGRPIAKFQAIQQELALAAGEVAASRAAADTAVRIVTETGFASQEAEFAVAVAKARTSEAAGVVARIAHQVLGAIGFTLEHDLRLFTTRLWAWRDEDGDEAHWNAVIARRVLVGGSDELWPVLTRSG